MNKQEVIILATIIDYKVNQFSHGLMPFTNVINKMYIDCFYIEGIVFSLHQTYFIFYVSYLTSY